MSECYFLYNSKLDKWECDKDNCFAWRTPLEHNSALANEVKDLERKLAEARRESDYLTRGIQVRDKMIKGLQEECVKLHLQLPIKPFTIQLKEKG